MPTPIGVSCAVAIMRPISPRCGAVTGGGRAPREDAPTASILKFCCSAVADQIAVTKVTRASVRHGYREASIALNEKNRLRRVCHHDDGFSRRRDLLLTRIKADPSSG